MVVRNLNIGARAGRSADKSENYDLKYLSYEVIKSYKYMCVGSYSSY